MTTQEFITSLKPHIQFLAQLYLPILVRWSADKGWDAVRQALYVKSVPAWYKAVRKLMTDAERDADDQRALMLVKVLAKKKAELIAQERDMLQFIVTQLIGILLAEL